MQHAEAFVDLVLADDEESSAAPATPVSIFSALTGAYDDTNEFQLLSAIKAAINCNPENLVVPTVPPSASSSSEATHSQAQDILLNIDAYVLRLWPLS
jgi:hypothetical protein